MIQPINASTLRPGEVTFWACHPRPYATVVTTEPCPDDPDCTLITYHRPPTGKTWTEHGSVVLVERGAPQVPCRWELTCRRAATTVINHSRLGEYAACVTCKTAFDEAGAGGVEPEPECWCPEETKRQRRAEPYCPRDGTPAERGLFFP